MLFRPNIGTWCKGTTFMGGTENVIIAMTCNLLATNLQLTCQEFLALFRYLIARYSVST